MNENIVNENMELIYNDKLYNNTCKLFRNQCCPVFILILIITTISTCTVLVYGLANPQCKVSGYYGESCGLRQNNIFMDLWYNTDIGKAVGICDLSVCSSITIGLGVCKLPDNCLNACDNVKQLITKDQLYCYQSDCYDNMNGECINYILTDSIISYNGKTVIILSSITCGFLIIMLIISLVSCMTYRSNVAQD